MFRRLTAAINRLADVIAINAQINAKLDHIIELLETDPAALRALAEKIKATANNLKTTVEEND